MTAALAPLLAALGPWALLVVLVILFVETGLLLGSFLPGDSLLFAAGVLVAAHAVTLPLWVVVAASALAAVAGDQVGYLLGRRYGPRIFHGTRSRLLNKRHAEHAERFFARYGGWAVVLARFVPVVRGFTPAAAGLARMPVRRFTVVNLLGGLAWTALLLTTGYYAGGIAVVAHHVELLALAMASVGVVPALVVWLRRRRRRTARPGGWRALLRRHLFVRNGPLPSRP
jgi:membrane-associated protein